MEDKIFDVNELIKVESLPKIFYQLEEIGKVVDTALVGIEDMVCDEDNKKEVKKRKQEITAFKNLMESKRKEIKNQVMEKYNEFNDKYEQEVKTKLVNAENILTEKYTTIEIQQKQDKENELREFAIGHFKYHNIEDIVKFEDINLNITLSSSIKSLKEQVLEFCKKIENDLQCISSDENRDEILYEYQHNNFNYQNAVLTVRRRKEEINKIQEQQKEVQLRIDEDAKIVEQIEEVVEEIITPVEVETPAVEDTEEQLVLTFTVKGTKEKLKKLKEYIIELGLEWN